MHWQEIHLLQCFFFCQDHLVFPATEYNATQRPKMSFMIMAPPNSKLESSSCHICRCTPSPYPLTLPCSPPGFPLATSIANNPIIFTEKSVGRGIQEGKGGDTLVYFKAVPSHIPRVVSLFPILSSCYRPFIVVYLATKSLIWSEAEGDLVVIETSIYFSMIT